MSDTAVETQLPVVPVSEPKDLPSDTSATEKPSSETSEVTPIKTNFFADDFFERNSWLLAYAAVWHEARIARHIRVTNLSAFIDSSLAHYEQLSGYQAPGEFQAELALQVVNNNSSRKFWSYGPLAEYLSERVPERYYAQMGVTTVIELAAEVRMAIESCLIWILCENEKMRNDVAAAGGYYKRQIPIEGYSRDGVFQDVNICDIGGARILSIRLHLFPDFIPNQGNVARQIGLVRRKGAIEYGILGNDVKGQPCYSTEYRTMAWGFRDHNGAPWFPRPVEQA